ncbi:MAG: phage portal protein, partial [Desulfovibrionaceae bacterium]
DDLHDGVEADGLGRARGYWVCNPPRDGWLGERLGSADYVRLPARIAHRPGVLHGFRPVRMEQFRGRSVLAPAMKSYRLLRDSWDYELIGQIVAASFPVFIATQDPHAAALSAGARRGLRGVDGMEAGEDPERLYNAYAPGQVLYGNANEKAQILESNRPGNNFQAFAQLILRSMAAATGMPYEVLAKDFSQTNYSSVRAALLEAWRVFLVYRAFAANHFCQVCWNMVQEEAWLRGLWTTPAGAPDFYDAMADYLPVRWIGPARGYVDPVKEIQAYIKGLDAGLFTYADAVAEQGADWEETMEQCGREARRRRQLGLTDDGADRGQGVAS